MKYRALSDEELEIFRDDFVSFLVVNGISADDWEELKSNDPEKSAKMVDIFSDHVFETVLKKVQYLERVADGNIKTFQCLESKMILVAFDTDSAFNSNSVKAIFEQSGDVYHAEKDYTKSREEELFDMICNGCSISNGDLFKQVSLLLA